MEKQDKELLIKELCARLPYKVRVKVWFTQQGVNDEEEGELDVEKNFHNVLNDFVWGKIYDIKPYLRPISAITNEEQAEINAMAYANKDYTGKEIYTFMGDVFTHISWFLEHHFDVNNLIEKGLAFEAPKDMYDIKSFGMQKY